MASLLAAGLSSSCASYNDRTLGALNSFEQGRFPEAIVAYREDGVTDSEFLTGAESGMVALVSGQWSEARAYFTQAAREVQDLEEEALVSPETAAETLASWAINDTFTDYHGEGYERVMLHSCLGLAYLALGQVEDLLVEVRRANALLEAEEELYDADYRAGGLGHLISALGYELRGDLDDAYIDYARMEAKGLGGPLVGSSLVRLSRELGREDDLARWIRRFGDTPAPNPDAVRVILIAGVGLGPLKEEVRIDIATPDGMLAWAVPVLRSRAQPVGSITLEVPSVDAAVRSVVIEDVADVASRNLDDRIAWLGTKSAVRTFLKRELRRDLEKKHGGWAALAGDIFTTFTERADLRTWGTLPDTWQAARIFLPPGRHQLTLSVQGGNRVPLGTFDMEAGETVFLLARTLHRQLHAHVIGGQPVISAPPSAPLPAPVEG